MSFETTWLILLFNLQNQAETSQWDIKLHFWKHKFEMQKDS